MHNDRTSAVAFRAVVLSLWSSLHDYQAFRCNRAFVAAAPVMGLQSRVCLIVVGVGKALGFSRAGWVDVAAADLAGPSALDSSRKADFRSAVLERIRSAISRASALLARRSST